METAEENETKVYFQALISRTTDQSTNLQLYHKKVIIQHKDETVGLCFVCVCV